MQSSHKLCDFNETLFSGENCYTLYWHYQIGMTAIFYFQNILSFVFFQCLTKDFLIVNQSITVNCQVRSQIMSSHFFLLSTKLVPSLSIVDINIQIVKKKMSSLCPFMRNNMNSFLPGKRRNPYLGYDVPCWCNSLSIVCFHYVFNLHHDLEVLYYIYCVYHA